jgi:uncharacterized membrane protein YcaP (DUF421 family)
MDIAVRAAVVFFFVFLVTRAVGRRELSSLEPFDLILLIITGDLVQQGVTQDDYSITGALTAIGTIAGLTVAVSYLSFRSPWWRRKLDGEPIVLVMNGRVLEGNLKRERLTREELEAEMRMQQIGSYEDVRLAVLETGGKVSVIPASSSGSG